MARVPTTNLRIDLPRAGGAQTLAAGDTGGLMHVGQALEQVTGEWKQQQDVANYSRAQVQALERINAAADAFEKDDGFNDLPERVQGQFGQIRSEVLETVPARLRPQFELDFARIAERRSTAVVSDARVREAEARQAELPGHLQTFAVTAAASGSVQEYNEALDQGLAKIDAYVEMGALRPPAAARLKAQFEAQAAEARARRAIRENPRAAAEFLKQPGALRGMAEDTREIMVGMAEGEADQIDRRAAAAVTEATAAAKVEAGLRIDDASRVVAAGQPLDPEEMLAIRAQVLDAADPRLAQRYNVLRQEDRITRENADRPIAELQDRVDTLRQTVRGAGSATATQAIEIGHIEKLLAAKQADRRQDPLRYAVDQNLLPGFKPGVLDVADPDPAQLRARFFAAKMAAASEGMDGLRVPPLFADELRAAKALLEGDDDAAAGRFIGELVDAGGGEAASVLDQLGMNEAGVTFAASSVAAGGGDEDLVRDVLRGRRLKGKHLPPPSAGLKGEAMTAVQALLPDLLVDMQPAAFDAIMALYATMAAEQGVESPEEVDEALLNRAVTRAFGGVGEVNGHKTVLPPGRTEDQVAAFLAGLRNEHMIVAMDLKFLGDLTGPVDGKGGKVSADTVRKARLIAVSPGQYLVDQSGEPGAPRYLLNPATGGYWVLDLNDASLFERVIAAPAAERKARRTEEQELVSDDARKAIETVTGVTRRPE